MTAAMRPARGFTLIEVLVALTVMAVLAGLAWRGVDAMLRAREATQDNISRTTRLNTVLAQWEQDLQAVFDTNVVPPLAFDGSTLRLVRRAELGGSEAGSVRGVRLVAWSRREGVWMRWASPAVTRASDLQDQWVRSQQLLGNEPEQLRLLEGVQDWQVFYFRGGARTNAQSSGDVAAPPAAAGSAAILREVMPDGVELQLQLAEGRLRRVVAVVRQP